MINPGKTQSGRASGMRPTLVRFVLVALLPLLAMSSAAQSADQTGRFQAHEKNYVIWQGTQGDQDALEARYSFRYLLLQGECEGWILRDASKKQGCDGGDEERTREVYFKYTGEFDFYYGTRPSGPVVNRVSNPAVHYRRYASRKTQEDHGWFRYIDIGLEHYSNGQIRDALEQRRGVFRAQTEFASNPTGPYFDTISRAVNFLSVEAQMKFAFPTLDDSVQSTSENVLTQAGLTCRGLASCIDVSVRVIPFYESDNNPVVWGRASGERRLANYDRVRLSVAKTFGRPNYLESTASRLEVPAFQVGIEWTLGDDMFDTDSVDIFAFLPIDLPNGWRVPLYARYHRGPLNNFSNFTEPQESLGLGFRLY